MPITNTVFPQTGQNTSDATATASQILSPYTAYVASGKVTGTIQSQPAQTFTPGTANQTIQSGVYLSGEQTVLGDSNLVPENIKTGVSIFGISGTLDPKTAYDYTSSPSSTGNLLYTMFSDSDLGTPRIICVNATSSVGQGSTTVSGIYSRIQTGTQGTAYITYGEGNVIQVSAEILSSADESVLTIGDVPGSVQIYLPTGYTFNGTYNLFVSFYN